MQHVHVNLCHRMKRPAFHENRFFIQGFRRLDHLAIGAEHRRTRKAELNQSQTHEPVVNFGEGSTRELNHVNFNASNREIVQK